MARYLGPKTEVVSHEKVQTFVPEERRSGPWNPSVAPRVRLLVMHGGRDVARLSDYAVQLREKQKVKPSLRCTGKAIPKLLQES